MTTRADLSGSSGVLRRLWGLVAGYSVLRVPKVEAPLRPSRVDEEMKALIRAAHEADHSGGSDREDGR